MKPFSETVCSLLSDFYRCPQLATAFALDTDLPPTVGYFRVNKDLICYGRSSQAQPATTVSAALGEAYPRGQDGGKRLSLPFDPAEVVANLRLENYVVPGEASVTNGDGLVRRLYYLLRPLMPVNVRKHLQRFWLRGWHRIPFPNWPLDRTVDRLHEWLLAAAMRAEGSTEVPFVWFWPDGYTSCATVTHDVETNAGLDFCVGLMDINDSYEVKTAFQLIPEKRYQVSPKLLDLMREREFEVNVHDLNHDGHLFRTHEQFLERAAKINQYGKRFNARGFRAAVLYRRLEWMSELDFAYDMSVPNVAHLDPQAGGCCTVMPYFVGKLLEIPVTTTQDYSLFHILREYSIRLWEEQVSAITRAHGMASFIIHPDYVIEGRAREAYKQLLGYLAGCRTRHNLWIARPGDINDWWRARAQMRLVKESDTWRIEGPESQRACVAYACVDGDRISYRVEKCAGRKAVGADKQ